MDKNKEHFESLNQETAPDIRQLTRQTIAAASELVQVASMQPGQILVIGCSTSEVRGKHIGSAGSAEVAQALLTGLLQVAGQYDIALAIQCCEHLNRALVVERWVMEKFNLEEVSVVPVAKAGGSLAAYAMRAFSNPVIVESIQAHAGMDIGHTLIGMHLKRVAVPVRLQQQQIGAALLVAARTRPKLIGGARAVYEA
ncbi:UPF0340 protein [Propionispora sp. 2/2-37]|uniref:TIGR01440 family protein n=1 Tax=Propionispora sp. 2/2-37 TaxID=1677858 RepID=UPI0006C26B0D|nr:TIGR01440 family protein [Propionispora sp. 2/2-37]CUH95481.1 UPF0340 protein [Propionispora sp. 2/2-37]